MALQVVQNGNSTAGLNQACVQAKVAAGADPLACRLPEVTMPFMGLPTFAVGSRFDPALDSIVGGEGGSNATVGWCVCGKEREGG